MSFYHSIGGASGRRSAGGSSRTSITAYERQLRQAQKLDQARELAAAFEHILSVHRQQFVSATPPVAPPPEPLDENAIRRRHERDALQGIGAFRRSARAEAKQRAAAAADREIQQLAAQRQQEHDDLQRQLDASWQRLLANDPEVVQATLTEAFGDNEAHAAVVGVHGDEVAIVVLVPTPDVVPERMPRVTDAGNLSLAKITKRERGEFYTLLVCGHVLVTLREALAVAPAIGSVRIAAVRLTPPDAYGAQKVECLLAAFFKREALRGVQWNSASAGTIVNDASAERSLRQGRSGELLPLDLSDEPALAALVHVLEVEQQGAGEQVALSAQAGALPSQPPPSWHPRPGWGTIRDYAAVPNDHGGTDVRCKFVPDDGSAPVQLHLPDAALPEAGEYARGIMPTPDQLTIKISASMMLDVEHGVFAQINAMEPLERAAMYDQRNDLPEDCGWAWTSDYRLVKAAPGLTH